MKTEVLKGFTNESEKRQGIKAQAPTGAIKREVRKEGEEARGVGEDGDTRRKYKKGSEKRANGSRGLHPDK